MPVMYETVTTPFLDSTNFPTRDFGVPIIKKPVPRSRPAYMLPSTMAARRTPNSGLSKGKRPLHLGSNPAHINPRRRFGCKWHRPLATQL